MFLKITAGFLLLIGTGCAPRMARTHYERWAQLDLARASAEKAEAKSAPTRASAVMAAPTPEAPRLVPRPATETEPPAAEEDKKEEKEEKEDFVY
ncbi:MAG: hypothetical protein HY791_14035 [Deltaproteobacteria bacterium]|nr:hypothetical protein [Deltaproteobacteria bacterium]